MNCFRIIGRALSSSSSTPAVVARLENFANRLPKRENTGRREEKSRHALRQYFSALIQHRFGFSAEESRRVTAVCEKGFDNQLASREAIDSSIQLVGQHFDAEDVRFNAQVFLVNARTLRNRVAILQELGFTRLTIVSSDSCFRHLCAQPVRALFAADLIRSPHVSQQLWRQLGEERESEENGEEERSLEEQRRRVLSLYLSSCLETPLERTFRLYDQKTSRLYLTPLRTIQTNVDFLRQECHFPVRRLLSSPWLLSLDTENARSIIKRIKLIGERPLLEIVGKYPKLLDTRHKTLEDNIRLLADNGFSSEQVLSAVLVLTLKTEELARRVNLLFENADLRPLSGCGRALRLVLQMRVVLQRAECLRGNGFCALTLSQLTGSSAYFERVLLGCGRKGGDLSAFCETVLKQKLSPEVRHPLEKRFNWRNAVQVYELLVSSHVSESQVARGVHLLLYEVSLVRRHMSALEEWMALRGEKEWSRDDNYLQLLLYFIEKNFGFSGRGVYGCQ